jgi:hypothetical protein
MSRQLLMHGSNCYGISPKWRSRHQCGLYLLGVSRRAAARPSTLRFQSRLGVSLRDFPVAPAIVRLSWRS